MTLLEETIGLEGFTWELAVAKTTYSPCGLDRGTAELDIIMPADGIEAGRVRVSWVLCVKTSEERLVGEDRFVAEGDKDVEGVDIFWLLTSDSGTLM